MNVLLLKRWLPAILVGAFIFVSSSLPGASVSSNGDVDYSAHKIAHILVYSLLTFTLYRATKNPLVAGVLASLYGITDEVHQTYVVSRSGNLIDALVDSSAAFTASFILWKYFHLLPNKLKTWLLE